MKAVEEHRLKGMLKAAVAEALEERQQFLRDLIRETIEDMTLIRAIEAGEKSSLVSRKKVFQRFQSAA